MVSFSEIPIESTERLYTEVESSILVKDRILCPATIQFTELGPKWKAHILTVPGDWLRGQYKEHGDHLFSANYRGFLGVNKRRKINSGIRGTAEKLPENFWVYNNGITILTNRMEIAAGQTFLHGISIINGAQTTGSIGSLESKISLEKVTVPARIIECSDHDTIEDIVKFNNTQNKITTWDKFSNSAEQKRISKEFINLGHHYSLKRGFSAASQVGIENVIQPLIAIEGHFADANGGKNRVFESEKMYRVAFEDKKARHILLAFAASRAIDELRNELKAKQANGSILPNEETQLRLLRNLRFKYFLIAVFGQTLSVMLGKRVDLGQIGLNDNYAIASKKSINDVVAELMPALNYVLTITASVMIGDFSELVRQESILSRVSSQVEAMVHANNSMMIPNPILDKLKNMLW